MRARLAFDNTIYVQYLEGSWSTTTGPRLRTMVSSRGSSSSTLAPSPTAVRAAPST